MVGNLRRKTDLPFIWYNMLIIRKRHWKNERERDRDRETKREREKMGF